MKKLILVVIMVLGGLAYNNVSAQVRLNVHVNIGDQPSWGPEGYDYVDYYYLPDIDAYYYVPGHQYIYWGGGRWIFAGSLPPKYRDFDLYHSYKVVINDIEPWRYHDQHFRQYNMYRERRNQVALRDSRDERYAPYRERWRDREERDYGHGKDREWGHDRERERDRDRHRD